MAALFFGLYCALSIRRHQQLRSAGYDLGIFEQAVRAYAHPHAPVAPLKGPGYNLLGDHFHPVLMLLARVYRVFPSPLTLLVAQAALIASAILPLSRWACQEIGPAAAVVTGFGVGASWGLVQAVHFDFHEVCFAVRPAAGLRGGGGGPAAVAGSGVLGAAAAVRRGRRPTPSPGRKPTATTAWRTTTGSRC
ncbi:DUF2079 domain-containing protein [Streptomyces sp. RB6PN25]|uniref:DUF2079 domain-containing protein n=1 Tax=Streptomyces humicola TaxID=2953240 RepID=A0ABT1PS98_9ACTN|nr:DUF2079 domain-containing protein [Streptomyces humicola]MCQ4080548.1 DUF2079 domain-containing protein [Streptomyces humicola]